MRQTGVGGAGQDVQENSEGSEEICNTVGKPAGW